MLIHGYASVNDLTVWRTIDESLPTLYETVTSLLDEADMNPTQRDRMD
ncbi:MAG: HepT-like ribonuclease domain-containing protein [Methylobacter sp.]